VIAFDFQALISWQRPARKPGFAWSGEHLVRVPGAAFEDYEPDVALFRDFADLDGSPEGILDFANRYGRLGREGDNLDWRSTWRAYIGLMRDLVAVTDALNRGDGKAIKAALGKVTAEELPAARDAHEATRIALEWVGCVMLTRRASFENFELTGDLNPRAGRVWAEFRPAHLLGFMLFQFAVALFGGHQFRRCAHCDRWFELSPSPPRGRRERRGRDDRTTCSDSCRSLLYRGRRRRAVDLHGQGWPVRKIAAEVGSTVAMVKKWVGAQRKEG
jgi:hypothetical protein